MATGNYRFDCSHRQDDKIDEAGWLIEGSAHEEETIVPHPAKALRAKGCQAPAAFGYSVIPCWIQPERFNSMRQILTLFRLTTVFAVILTVAASLADAEETATPRPVTGGAVAADLLIARPLGLVATVLGIGTCIVTLPFTLINGNTGQAAQKLIVEPAEYTFTRPLGKGI